MEDHYYRRRRHVRAFKPSDSAGTGRGGKSDTVADVSAGAMDASVHVATRSLQVSKEEMVHLRRFFTRIIALSKLAESNGLNVSSSSANTES